jgi:hypothetical protein
MKTINVKSLIFTWMATIIAIVGISGVAFGQTTASPVKNSPSFIHEKTAINRDLASISADRDRVKVLEKEVKDERAARQKTCSTRADLVRANADLQRQKDYLKADKAELMDKHDEAIKEWREVIQKDRASLMNSHVKLETDLAKGRPDAVTQTQAMVNDKYNLKHSQFNLKEAVVQRNNDLLAVNKQIKNANGQSPVTLAFENGYAKTQNLAMK